jgi:D-threo-aldose 1-dehydrogenase
MRSSPSIIVGSEWRLRRVRRAVLQACELRGTGITTSTIGFGCAGLFSLPQRRQREFVLDAMYDAGVRHFDVAPMYGLGLAEKELASFLKRRRSDVTVATKFGIEPTAFTRTIAPFQEPVRAFLATHRNVRDGVRAAGRGPRKGALGSLLYSDSGYDRQAAALSLDRSLRALGTDCVDILLLHDPSDRNLSGAAELADYLDKQCSLGRIRAWGVTGQRSGLGRVLARLGRVPVIQERDDIFEPLPVDEPVAGSGRITYGALRRALGIVRRFLDGSPATSKRWSQRLGVDLADESSIAKMLLSVAVQRNPHGPVLFTTTRPARAQVAVEAAMSASDPGNSAHAELLELAEAVRLENPEMILAS